MSAEVFLFSLFAILSILSAGGVVLIRDPVKAAMSLVTCFFSIACLFMLQRAELIAVLEVLVYAGAIMVLFVFVIMLVENKNDAIVAQNLSQRIAVPVKFLAVALVAASLGFLVNRTGNPKMATLAPDFGTVKAIGKVFLTDYLFHFEFTSLLLLTGIVGAVIVTKGRHHR